MGRMMSPDPYVIGSSTQGFNRYSYALNNPLKYTDPDGEWIILAAAVVGGLINWATNGAEFTWRGLGLFAVGAASGALMATGSGGVILGGALLGGGNAALVGASNGGIDGGNVIRGVLVGAITSGIGLMAGPVVSQAGARVFNGISNPVVRNIVVHSSAQAVVGGATGAAGAAMTGGNAWDGFKSGFGVGLATGGIYGTIVGRSQQLQQRSQKIEPLWQGDMPEVQAIETPDYRAGSSAEVKSVNLEDLNHSFPKHVDNYIFKVRDSYTNTIINGDKSISTLHRFSGSYRGVDGVFEYIIKNGKIDHRIFIPGGNLFAPLPSTFPKPRVIVPTWQGPKQNYHYINPAWKN